MDFSTDGIAVWILDRNSDPRFVPCYDPREEILIVSGIIPQFWAHEHPPLLLLVRVTETLSFNHVTMNILSSHSNSACIRLSPTFNTDLRRYFCFTHVLNSRKTFTTFEK